ncbi:hypothetical protein C7271_11065 [filamentous cyanobacterium CCP5]|nr:hypothetical protein C7271_11065 [filamentous cyanobacterium CCP5]
MSAEFEKYLTFISRDRRYQDVRNLYTKTEALIPLEAETVERKPDRPEADIEQVQKKVERFPVLEGLRKTALGRERQHVLLAGRPGSGKSTTLKRLLLELADGGVTESTVIPVYVQLKSDRPITDLIGAEFRKAKVRVTSEQLDDWLLQDQLLLLLDGVNEIPSEERRRQLQDFRNDNLTAPMIFTMRDLSVGGDLGIAKQLEMRPLSEPQMREFVGKYLANRGMPDQADTLLRQLKDRLREIAETPLLLKLLCEVFDPATRQIPQSKGELFRQFDQKYDRIKKDAEYVPVSENFWEFKADILQFLAFSMIQTDDPKSVEAWYSLSRDRAERLLEEWLNGRGVSDPATKAKLWLKDLHRCHLLQDAKDPGEIEFHHQLFQEYYAAEYLRQRLPKLSDGELKRDYLNLLKWTEAIALMLALVDKEEQALRVVRLATNDVDLILGAELAGALRQEFQREAVWEISNSQLDDATKVCLLRSTHSAEAVALLVGILSESNLNISKEVALALYELEAIKEIRESEHHLSTYVDEHLKSLNLMEQFEDDEVPYTLESEIDDLREHLIMEILLSDEECDRTLSDFLSALLRRINCIGDSPDTSEDFDFFLELLRFSDAGVRSSAAKILGFMKNVKATSSLLSAINDPNYKVRMAAAEALGILNNRSTISHLKSRLEKEFDIDVRFEVIEALSHLAMPKDLPFFWATQQNSRNPYYLSKIKSIQNRCRLYNYEIFHGIIPQGKTISLYFSYASADEALQTQLANHLTLLERDEIITSWSQRQILPGDDLNQIINQQLNTADIILLLISANSLADDTCYDLEIQRAIERHQAGEARVIPILLRPVDWAGAPFSQLPVLPKNHQPVTSSHWTTQDEAFQEIAEGIRAVAMEIRKNTNASIDVGEP